ncbi:fructose-2,6-bisphosphatase TIGAR isoform X2 [Trachemys scripta elegans]|uniref:fructose-2,6-bisphosphatase TIGAR isoform X2 n=1 Tax=Trachemys scripta elegans TaxID=31138 RepID=UPI00155821F6|nr:fructose-2,6-bisphosphatase TIGAR isoform X2 [Trachemys scripta elegans]
MECSQGHVNTFSNYVLKGGLKILHADLNELIQGSPLALLYRSGETRYNKDKILQGQGVDEPLSATGFRQADAAGVFLSNVKFTHVFSSDLLRAKQTASTIIGKNKFCKDIVIQYDARLRERKYGIAEGRPLSDLKAMAKAAGEQCPSFTPSGGETLDEVRARAKNFFEFLCQLSIEEECQKEQAVLGMAGNGLETLEGKPVFPLRNRCCGLELNSDTDKDTKMLNPNVLVVSHGAYMRNWFGYFVLDLKCTLPSALKKSQLSSVSPNTGVSHFIINLGNGDVIKPEISCICLNRDDHLADVNTENL